MELFWALAREISTLRLSSARADSVLPSRRDWEASFGEGGPVTIAAMMLDWNDYLKQILASIGEMAELSPDTVRGYRVLGEAGAKTAHLEPKIRELIALAVAVTTRCDGCITVHTSAALKHGATKEEIAEALGVAVALNAGAALVYSARVLDAYHAKAAQPA